MTLPSPGPDAADVDVTALAVLEPDVLEPDVLEIDVRGLPAPEPMLRILEALDGLRDGQALLARTPCHPRPLLERLARMGFRADVVVEPAGDARVLIVCTNGAAGA